MRNEFDIPYWAFVALQRPSLKECNNSFVYQLKACNIHCLWCYVDDFNKNPRMEGGRFFSINEILDIFEKEKEEQPLCILRPSGGEPTLAIEQWLDILRGVERRNLEAYVQGETNLTTDILIDYLWEKNEIEKDYLGRVAEYKNFGVLCSFKGTDEYSFSRITKLDKEFHEHQFIAFKKLLDAGIDVYPFIYDPNPDTLESFLDRGARIFGEGFYLKTWISKLKTEYEAERERLNKLKINPEEYQKQLDENLLRSKGIMQEIIFKKFKVDYQSIPRTQIKLGRG